MKVVAVILSTVKKYRRLDPSFYVGAIDGHEQAKKVEDAKASVARAISRLQNAIAEQTAQAARTRRLIDSGEVVPITPGNTSDDQTTNGPDGPV